MAYTVKELAKLSGVSVRTLHWYDEMGLLRPAYHGANGYRYYEEEQLLMLQQILFFKKLGFELKQIRALLDRSDFNKMVALQSHKGVLKKKLAQTKKLIKTIEQTIEHLKGNIKMNEKQIFSGFSDEQQAEYEREIIERFGAEGKAAIEESKYKAKDRSEETDRKLKEEFVQICQSLAKLVEDGRTIGSEAVQKLIAKHYQWLKNYWTPTKDAYIAHGEFIKESDLQKVYEAYHPKLPQFVADAIKFFADTKLA